MNEKTLDDLWAQVEHIGRVVRLDDDAMIALGSVFGQLSEEIRRLQQQVKELDHE